MGKKALLLVPVLMFLLFLSAGPASATEGARGVYPNGAEDCYAGCLPPPGTYFINYNAYITWDTWKDSSGHKVRGNPPEDGDAFATVFRFIHGTGCKVLGADWYVHILLPVTYAHLKGLGSDGHGWGMGNVTVSPMILGWHFGDWHIAAGVDINLPAPGWDKDKRPVGNGLGTGYYNVEPIFAFTYLNKEGWEFGAKFMYDYNWENWATNYQTGQEFHFDTAFAKKFKNGFLAAIVGYAWWQVSKDEYSGDSIDDTDKGRVFAVGPMVRYDYKNMFFSLKWYHEFEAQSTFEGDAIWFKWFYAF